MSQVAAEPAPAPPAVDGESAAADGDLDVVVASDEPEPEPEPEPAAAGAADGKSEGGAGGGAKDGADEADGGENGGGAGAMDISLPPLETAKGDGDPGSSQGRSKERLEGSRRRSLSASGKRRKSGLRQTLKPASEVNPFTNKNGLDTGTTLSREPVELLHAAAVLACLGGLLMFGGLVPVAINGGETDLISLAFVGVAISVVAAGLTVRVALLWRNFDTSENKHFHTRYHPTDPYPPMLLGAVALSLVMATFQCLAGMAIGAYNSNDIERDFTIQFAGSFSIIYVFIVVVLLFFQRRWWIELKEDQRAEAKIARAAGKLDGDADAATSAKRSIKSNKSDTIKSNKSDRTKKKDDAEESQTPRAARKEDEVQLLFEEPLQPYLISDTYLQLMSGLISILGLALLLAILGLTTHSVDPANDVDPEFEPKSYSVALGGLASALILAAALGLSVTHFMRMGGVQDEMIEFDAQYANTETFVFLQGNPHPVLLMAFCAATCGAAGSMFVTALYTGASEDVTFDVYWMVLVTSGMPMLLVFACAAILYMQAHAWSWSSYMVDITLIEPESKHRYTPLQLALSTGLYGENPEPVSRMISFVFACAGAAMLAAVLSVTGNPATDLDNETNEDTVSALAFVAEAALAAAFVLSLVQVFRYGTDRSDDGSAREPVIVAMLIPFAPGRRAQISVTFLYVGIMTLFVAASFQIFLNYRSGGSVTMEEFTLFPFAFATGAAIALALHFFVQSKLWGRGFDPEAIGLDRDAVEEAEKENNDADGDEDRKAIDGALLERLDGLSDIQERSIKLARILGIVAILAALLGVGAVSSVDAQDPELSAMLGLVVGVLLIGVFFGLVTMLVWWLPYRTHDGEIVPFSNRLEAGRTQRVLFPFDLHVLVACTTLATIVLVMRSAVDGLGGQATVGIDTFSQWIGGISVVFAVFAMVFLAKQSLLFENKRVSVFVHPDVDVKEHKLRIEAESEVERLQERMVELKDEKIELQEQLNKLRDELNKLREQGASNVTDAEAAGKIALLEKEIAELKELLEKERAKNKDSDDTDERIKELELQLERAKTDVDQERRDHEETRKQLEDMRAKLEALQGGDSKAGELLEQRDKELSELRKQLAEAQEALEDAKKELEELRDVKRACDECQQDRKAMQEEIDRLKKELEALQQPTDDDSLRDQVEYLTKQLASTSAQRDALSEEVADLRKKLAAEQERANEDLLHLRETVARQDGELEELRSENDQLKDRIAELEKRVSASSAPEELERLRELLDAERAARVEDEAHCIAEKKELRQELEAARRQAAKDRAEMERELAELAAELERFREQVARKSKAIIDDAKARLAKMRPLVGVEITTIGGDAVKVLDVRPNKPGYHAGIQERDLISSVKDMPTPTNPDFSAAISSCVPGDIVTFKIMRKKDEIELDVEIGTSKYTPEEVREIRRLAAGKVRPEDLR